MDTDGDCEGTQRGNSVCARARGYEHASRHDSAAGEVGQGQSVDAPEQGFRNICVWREHHAGARSSENILVTSVALQAHRVTFRKRSVPRGQILRRWPVKGVVSIRIKSPCRVLTVLRSLTATCIGHGNIHWESWPGIAAVAALG